jgi:hypothetical protein
MRSRDFCTTTRTTRSEAAQHRSRAEARQRASANNSDACSTDGAGLLLFEGAEFFITSTALPEALVTVRPIELPPQSDRSTSMVTTQEMRSFASDCLRWSDETRSASHRSLMQEIAHTWIAVAARIDRHVDDGGQLVPPTLRYQLN